eukprot:gnl/MRDRNA2_/MRDRNA2_74695_c0_seq3.p1 gnl/MRDRNA2_/MRDRNA2_74695_c0~~gnl/MRDRNA2_/MRDRNA2_74695_c0_seq3.p1  ORF type:complete len:161 (-),score=4.36 gnl/MRDRNA2_/MRDRNA2_74695_c0_seq3:776-1258(-)
MHLNNFRDRSHWQPFSQALTCRIVTDEVWCHLLPRHAFLQDLQCKRSMLTSLARADDYRAASCIDLNSFFAHFLQKIERTLPVATFITSAHSCSVADCGCCCPNLTLREHVQCMLPARASLESTDDCIVCHCVQLNPIFLNTLPELQCMLSFGTLFTCHN